MTSLSHGGGCGCKIAPGVLAELLKGSLPNRRYADLLVGTDTSDDAAVYRLNETQAVVATTDFFMPIVDDPFDFGRIAATNALSDIYAMGGRPLLALAIVGMPINTLPRQTIREILRGGETVCERAGIPIAGGHSIDSVEPIYGLAVTGVVDPNKVKRNSSARSGDVLILGKPLGVGIFSAAFKKGLLDETGYRAMIETTTQLNLPGTELSGLAGVHAMTDVTGFGLLGHLLEMCRGSGLAAGITAAQLPLLPGALELAQAGITTGAFRPELAVLRKRRSARAAPGGAAAGLADRSADIGGIARRLRPGRIVRRAGAVCAPGFCAGCGHRPNGAGSASGASRMIGGTLQTATSRLYERRLSPGAGIVILLIVAIAGLFYVKWLPYYHKALLASASHSIGRSILTGMSAQAPPPSWKAALDYSLAYGKAIWQAMVLGLLLGAALQEFAPISWMARTLGRSSWRGVVTGGLLAIPGMMCTCCAAPVVIGLRRRNASAAAATAFWLGNTLLNPATLVFMGFVLGWKWTGLRLALGAVLVFGTGYLISRWALPGETEALNARLNQTLSEARSGSPSIKSWLTRFVRLLIGLIPEYLILVLILGAARAWMFPHSGPAIDNGLQWIVLMSAAGLLFVIPTAGEVPIVQAMLALGVGAGPAAALIMTLPPISLPSLAMTGRVFPMRALAVIIAAVFIMGIAAGALAVLLRF